MKVLLALISMAALSITGTATADHHMDGPIGYGVSYHLNVSDPAAIIGAVTEVRTTDLGKNSPSSVNLRQMFAGGQTGATHTISVFYQSAADIDKAQAMNAAMEVGKKIGPVFQAASERIAVTMWTLLRASRKEGAVTSENPVSMGYLLQVTDPAAFTAAFDPVWKSVSESFPGNVVFGAILANGDSPGTHFVSFSANNMETLLKGVQTMQASPAMSSYVAKASSFRSLVSEQISMRILDFPQSSN